MKNGALIVLPVLFVYVIFAIAYGFNSTLWDEIQKTYFVFLSFFITAVTIWASKIEDCL